MEILDFSNYGAKKQRSFKFFLMEISTSGFYGGTASLKTTWKPMRDLREKTWLMIKNRERNFLMNFQNSNKSGDALHIPRREESRLKDWIDPLETFLKTYLWKKNFAYYKYDLKSVTRHYKKTKNSKNKLTNQAFFKKERKVSLDKLVRQNKENRSKKRRSSFRTAGKRKTFSKGDPTKLSFETKTIEEDNNETIPTCLYDNSSQRYSGAFVKKLELTLKEREIQEETEPELGITVFVHHC